MSRLPRSSSPSRPISIKITDAERAAWRVAAGDKTLSDWARDVLNRAAARANRR